eukprot:CAMPEP_0113584812 /NCGR_PEP_ID=MMETSP0015_2-20120614/33313_1 /TAXON_ID=2838 /ORGANISM="Odontella" /LENGTH=133 /DNA_ID=CAMNT_0000489907 /DNA_START=191 /DNA_END=588 /DNA_ORIENTATION=+ /assembly_acc=CAM_ASM_000160
MRIAKSALAALVLSSGYATHAGAFSSPAAATFSPRPFLASASASTSSSLPPLLPRSTHSTLSLSSSSSSAAVAEEDVAASDAAPSSSYSLTSVFLDAKSYPPGSLLPSHLDDPLPLCLRWARASADAARNDRR